MAFKKNPEPVYLQIGNNGKIVGVVSLTNIVFNGLRV